MLIVLIILEMKKEYHIKCRTDSTSGRKFIILLQFIVINIAASYKIIKGMRMEMEQILTNKTGTES